MWGLHGDSFSDQWVRGACVYIWGGGPCLCAQVWREEFVGVVEGGSWQ